MTFFTVEKSLMISVGGDSSWLSVESPINSTRLLDDARKLSLGLALEVVITKPSHNT